MCSVTGSRAAASDASQCLIAFAPQEISCYLRPCILGSIGMNGSPLRYKKSARQVSCKINDEVAILDLDRAIYFGLQGVGVHIWDWLEQPRSVQDLCASVMAEFEVSEVACQADVVQIVGSLEAEGLIEASR
jgi:hypothetical protein